MRRVHYSGELRYVGAHGSSLLTPDGRVPCCSKERSDDVIRRGNHTKELASVTCLNCIVKIELATGVKHA